MGETNGAEGLEQQLVELKQWVAKAPHIPKDMDDKLLRRFLHSCYYDMEKAQKAMEAFTGLRLSTPELFVARDPLSPQIQNTLKIVILEYALLCFGVCPWASVSTFHQLGGMGDCEDTQKLEKQLVELKEWVTNQPHIPKDLDDKLLRRFPHSCYYDLEKAKQTLEMFTSIRASSPELFTDRDPLGARVRKALEIVKMAQYRISGNRNLWIVQLNDPGLRNFEHTEFIRNFMLAFDAWFLENDHLQEEDITIFDARDMSLRIFWKLKMSVAKKMTQYQEEGLPIRVKQMHMVNAPYFFDKLFAILKQFMSKEMTDMVHFHEPGSDTLYEFFSRDELPKDFGGNLESLDYYHERVLQQINKHRTHLTKDDLWRAPQEKSKNNIK